MVPAAAHQPAVGVGDGKIPQGLLHRCQGGGGLAGQVAHFHGVAVAEQMHVAVVEAGADKAALQGDDGIRILAQGEHFCIRAGSEELVILHNKGFLEGQRAGKDLAAQIDRAHGDPSRCDVMTIL